MVRSVFRLIEYAQGNAGYLISHEAHLYLFDSVLMFLTMALLVWEHPSQLNSKLRGEELLFDGAFSFIGRSERTMLDIGQPGSPCIRAGHDEFFMQLNSSDL